MLERRARFHKTQEAPSKTTIQPTHKEEWDNIIEEEDSHLNISTDDSYINFDPINMSSDEDNETNASHTPPNATDTPSSKHSEQDTAEWETPEPGFLQLSMSPMSTSPMSMSPMSMSPMTPLRSWDQEWDQIDDDMEQLDRYKIR